jgi:hypothetical protein
MTLAWYKNKLLSHLSYEEAKELVESLDEDVRHQLEYNEFRFLEESTLEKENGTLSSAFDFKKSALLSDDDNDKYHQHNYHSRKIGETQQGDLD